MKLTHVSRCILTAGLAMASLANAQAAPAAAKAIVIFFTPGGHWRGTGEKLNPFAGKAKTASTGTIFEGSEAMAKMSHSRFVILQMEPGPHTFSAGRGEAHPNQKEANTVDLKPGSVTYFAVTTTAPSLLAGYSVAEKSHLTPSTCAAFSQDHPEPIELSQVAPKYRPLLDETFDPARCTP